MHCYEQGLALIESDNSLKVCPFGHIISPTHFSASFQKYKYIAALKRTSSSLVRTVNIRQYRNASLLTAH